MADGNSGNNRMMTLMVLIVGLICLANLIVVSIILNNPSTPDVNLSPTINTIANPISDALQKIVDQTLHPNSTAPARGKRNVANSPNVDSNIHLVQYGHNFGAYEYIDEEGSHRGFFRDLIEEVCDAANIECRPIYDDYKNCWMDRPGEHPVGGQGLMDGWYDACIGWAPTTERVHVFDFTDAFTNNMKSYFYVKAGASFDEKNLSGKKIGFVEGWADNEKCLAKNSASTILELDQIVYYKDPKTLAHKLTNGQIDAAFASEAAMDMYTNSKVLSKVPDVSYLCSMDGLSVMTRKDSTFLASWHHGFQRIRANGQLTKLCKRAQKQHGDLGPIDCVHVGRVMADEL